MNTKKLYKSVYRFARTLHKLEAIIFESQDSIDVHILAGVMPYPFIGEHDSELFKRYLLACFNMLSARKEYNLRMDALNQMASLNKIYWSKDNRHPRKQFITYNTLKTRKALRK